MRPKEHRARIGLKEGARPKQPIHPGQARSSPSLADKLEARRQGLEASDAPVEAGMPNGQEDAQHPSTGAGHALGRRQRFRSRGSSVPKIARATGQQPDGLKEDPAARQRGGSTCGYCHVPSAPMHQSSCGRRGGSPCGDCHVPTAPGTISKLRHNFETGWQALCDPLNSWIGEHVSAWRKLFPWFVRQIWEPAVRAGNWTWRSTGESSLWAERAQGASGYKYSTFRLEPAVGVTCKDNIFGCQHCASVQCQHVSYGMLFPWQRGGRMSGRVALASGHAPSEPSRFHVPLQKLEASKIPCAYSIYMHDEGHESMLWDPWQRGGWRSNFCRASGHVPSEPCIQMSRFSEFNVVFPPCMYGGRLSTLFLEPPCSVLCKTGMLQCNIRGDTHDIAMLGFCNGDARIQGNVSVLLESKSIHRFGYFVQAVLSCGWRLGKLFVSFETPCQRGLIWDAKLGRSAEVTQFHMLLLQRQILLPVAFGFANGPAKQLCLSDRYAFNETPSPPSSFSPSCTSECQLEARDGLCGMIRQFPSYVEFLMGHFQAWIWILVMDLGKWWQQAFTFLALTGCMHMSQLLLYAVQLKGGQYNVDNLLLFSRKICGGCPLDSAIVLTRFSPRLSSTNQPRKVGFSGDLWLLLMITSALYHGVEAGAGSRHNVDSTGFRARRRSRKLASAVYNLRSACRNLDSSDLQMSARMGNLRRTLRQMEMMTGILLQKASFSSSFPSGVFRRIWSVHF